MTDNNFQHFPIGNNKINIAIQPPAAPGALHPSCPSSLPPLQKFMFEFGNDGIIHSASFLGNLAHDDIRLMLEFLHQKLYADCGRSIHSYLEHNNIPYSHLKTDTYLLNHQEIMNQAECLLQSCVPKDFGVRISESNNYYAVMDQQARTPDGGCEGCYYAVQKSVTNENFHYHIIGQTYHCSKSDDSIHGYFAVRTGEDGQKFLNLDTKAGEPLFPTFGCVDIMGVLINIDHITTSGQTKKTALR